MAVILITGGTGLIGSALSRALADKGHESIILTRQPGRHEAGHKLISYAGWDVNRQEIDASAIGRADVIVHLAGAGVADKRWTDKRKKEIVNSRVQSSALLIKALTEYPNKVKTVISASAIGWYGPDPVVPNPDPFGESMPASNDFLGRTCKAWEESILPVTATGRRLVILRTGIVLSEKGGALREFMRPLKAGLATVLGTGKQVVSWIHIDDLVQQYLDAMDNTSFQGIYNAVAPYPVTHRELILELARHLNGRRFIPVPVPSFALRIALGEMSIEVLKSATVSAGKMEAAGYRFKYPRLPEAIAAVRK